MEASRNFDWSNGIVSTQDGLPDFSQYFNLDGSMNTGQLLNTEAINIAAPPTTTLAHLVDGELGYAGDASITPVVVTPVYLGDDNGDETDPDTPMAAGPSQEFIQSLIDSGKLEVADAKYAKDYPGLNPDEDVEIHPGFLNVVCKWNGCEGFECPADDLWLGHIYLSIADAERTKRTTHRQDLEAVPGEDRSRSVTCLWEGCNQPMKFKNLRVHIQKHLGMKRLMCIHCEEVHRNDNYRANHGPAHFCQANPRFANGELPPPPPPQSLWKSRSKTNPLDSGRHRYEPYASQGRGRGGRPAKAPEGSNTTPAAETAPIPGPSSSTLAPYPPHPAMSGPGQLPVIPPPPPLYGAQAPQSCMPQPDQTTLIPATEAPAMALDDKDLLSMIWQLLNTGPPAATPNSEGPALSGSRNPSPPTDGQGYN